MACSPSHECDVCHEDADERGEPIGCRRCPKSYHRACLPDALYNAPNRRVWISNRELGACHEPFPFFSCQVCPQSCPYSGHIGAVASRVFNAVCLLERGNEKEKVCGHVTCLAACLNTCFAVLAEEELVLSDGVVECKLERSLLYCLAHPIAAGEESPPHARALFRRALPFRHMQKTA